MFPFSPCSLKTRDALDTCCINVSNLIHFRLLIANGTQHEELAKSKGTAVWPKRKEEELTVLASYRGRLIEHFLHIPLLSLHDAKYQTLKNKK
ncbi:hypothetical protein I7I48_11057 [Histoplasma ohiense]|nr:hypothetical protein I7I48_11057 [Histoplasma ohiense (nom. inval.)]